MKHLFIFGTGGFGREALYCFVDICKSKNINYTQLSSFVVDDEFFVEDKLMGVPVIKRSEFNCENGEVFVAVGDPFLRQEVVGKLPEHTNYTKLIHPSALISEWVTVGEGSIVCAGVVLTTHISIGKHAHLNLNTTIGHDCEIGNYFTSSPGVNISGDCIIGNKVFVGTNSAVREKTNICDDVIIGMSSSVLNSIEKPGIYIGSPAKRIN